MLLSSDLSVHQSVPKEYELGVTDENVANTFVFTEQDLPGFKSKSKAKFDASSANMPARLTRGKNERTGPKQPYDPNKRFQPYYRKAIPSECAYVGEGDNADSQIERTTLAGRVAHEVNCVPVENDEAKRLMAIRMFEETKPKVATRFLNEDVSGVGTGFVQPGTVGAMNAFGGFIVKALSLRPSHLLTLCVENQRA